MKYKLSGLLMFSQAAACALDFFTPATIKPNAGPTPAQWLIDAEARIILNDYKEFCGAQTDYIHAAEKALWYENYAPLAMITEPCPDTPVSLRPEACAEYKNIAYTQFCQRLKTDKAQMPDAWNQAARKMEPCNNIRK